MSDRADGVLVVGEALVDVSIDAHPAGAADLALRARAGGSPANVAVGLARLGVRTLFAGRLSRDPFGAFLRAHLERSGVDLSLSVPAPQPTTVALVGLDESGAAAYSFYVEGTADWQWARGELALDPPAHVIHTGSLAVALEPGGAMLADWIGEQRRRRGVFLSLDPNVRPALGLERRGYRERLDAMIAQAQLVKASDEDLRALEPRIEPLATARAWAQRGPELVVITHGARGATALTADGRHIHRAAAAVTVRDSVGAGDAFTAGLLAFLDRRGALASGACGALGDDALSDALGFAARVAALTCSRAGADPPWQAELDAAPPDGAS